MLIQESVLAKSKSDIKAEDPDVSGIKVTGWNILVRPVEAQDAITTAKGVSILLPTSTKDDIQYLSNVCKVLKVGSLAYTQESFKGEVWCKVGDYVLLPKLVGTRLNYKGVPLTMVACDRVLAVIENPADLDLKQNITR